MQQLSTPAQAAPSDAVGKFRRASAKLLDILRTPELGITGFESVRTICLYLQFRALTKGPAAILGIDEDLSWDRLIATLEKAEGGSETVARRVSSADPGAPSLVRRVAQLYGEDWTGAQQPALKSAARNKELLEALADVDLAAVSRELYPLGWVYEQHLGGGHGRARGGASARASKELGPHFTDRGVCEFAVGLCAPGFKAPGVPEAVCDAAMGVGCFLEAYLRHYDLRHPGVVDWRVQQKEVHGNGDAKTVGLARCGLSQAHGGVVFGNLRQRAPLNEDLAQTGYDVIIGSMPPGVRGIKHAECCPRVKALKIRGTKSEPLFLQLMMVSLNPGGRCAVVVPDAMLSNAAVLHEATRRYLLAHFELRAVVKLRGQLSPAVASSILFFANTGAPTREVVFRELDLLPGTPGGGSAVEILRVPAAELDAAFTLDARRYLKAPPCAAPPRYPSVPLGEVLVAEEEAPASPPEAAGDVPLFSASPEVLWCSAARYRAVPCLVQAYAGGGEEALCAHYAARPFAAAGNVWVFRAKPGAAVDLKYLYYYLRLEKPTAPFVAEGEGRARISLSDFTAIGVPFPPLSVQGEIAATLDRLVAPGTADLDAKLASACCELDGTGANVGALLGTRVRGAARDADCREARVKADVRKSMEAVMKASLGRGTPCKLGVLAEIEPGDRVTIKSETPGEFPVYGGGGQKPCAIARFNREPTCVVDNTGVTDNCVRLVRRRFFLNQHGWTLKPKPRPADPQGWAEVLEPYLHWQLFARQREICALASSEAPRSILQAAFTELEISAPPVELQRDVVARLEALQGQLDALEGAARRAEADAKFVFEACLA